MATIRKRSTKQWQVQVRIAGHPTLSKTFTSKVEANKWANEKEDEIRSKVGVNGKERKFKVVTGNKKREGNRTHAQTHGLTLDWLLVKYQQEISFRKKGHQHEVYRLRMFRRDLGHIALTNLTPPRLLEWVDRRKKEVSPTP